MSVGDFVLQHSGVVAASIIIIAVVVGITMPQKWQLAVAFAMAIVVAIALALLDCVSNAVLGARKKMSRAFRLLRLFR